MKLLIDTNIIIHLEDNKVLNKTYTDLINLAYSNNCAIYYHSDCEKDLRNDRDEHRKSITLSKLKKYMVMPNPGIPNEEFFSIVENKNSNDVIDSIQLYQAYCHYVDLLITEDTTIHKKAKRLALDNVVNVKSALKILGERFTFKIPSHPVLETASLRTLVKELSHPFFDSLRIDYPSFNKWFLKSAEKNRQCYVFKAENQLAGLLIYNIENAIDHKLKNIHDDALKICTLEVAETAFGNKLGELFLSKMFKYCIDAEVPCLYLTVYRKHSHLIQLLESFGFNKHISVNEEHQELIYIKSIRKDKVNFSANEKIYHPFYNDTNEVSKYVVPIQDSYYNTLFKDANLRQGQLFDKQKEGINEIEGNTITKAYICSSPNTKITSGSLLLFYSSKNKQLIESYPPEQLHI